MIYSKINLLKIPVESKATEIRKYFISLPKGDLHVHLSGVLTIEDIKSICKKLNLDSPALNNLRKHFDFFDPILWKVLQKIMTKPEGIAEAAKIAINEFSKDGIKKSEIIINTGSIIKKTLDIEKVTQVLSPILLESKIIRDIDCKIRLGVNRRNGPKALLQVSKIFRYFKDSGIFCGLDLNGDERMYPTSEFIEPFKKIKKMDIPFTIHAGEDLDQIMSLQQAIRLRPQRIGHGIAAIKEENLIEDLKRERIPLEICPTSNIKTGSVISLKAHPIFRLIEMNLPLIIATDNPGLFRTSLSKEYYKLYNLGISKESLTKIANFSLII